MEKMREDVTQCRFDKAHLSLLKERATLEKDRLRLAQAISHLMPDRTHNMDLNNTDLQPKLPISDLTSLLSKKALFTLKAQPDFIFNDTESECFTCYWQPVQDMGKLGTYFGQVD